MEKVLQVIEGKEQEMLAFLEKLVNIDSGNDNPEGIAEVAKTIGMKLNDMGFRVKYLEYPDVCNHVIATKQGSGNKQVSFGYEGRYYCCALCPAISY